jgi:hypothetical protein
MVTPNTLTLDERRGKAIQTGTDFEAIVVQVAYETGISTPEACKKV